ncbi:MAG: translation initiation factor IF-2 subunit beta [Methanobacteriota archaeon]|nr:MAG: translation initiation factor IF-2 subunit beta [Euryarchaeota archaeon]
MKGQDNDYESMLDSAYANLPKGKGEGSSRFVVPEVDSIIEGNKTIIKNFHSIAEKVRRDISILSKFFSRELGAPVSVEGNFLIIQKKVKREVLQKKVEAFIMDYVICHECKKPDTKIVVVDGVRSILCEACGARRVARK